MKPAVTNKRELKYSTKPLTEFSSVSPYFRLLFNPITFFTAWHFIFTVIRKFFLIQQFQLFHLAHRPVIYVDTDLDEKIPFTPSKVTVYIGFVAFFVRPMDMLIKRLGFIKASRFLIDDVRYLTRMYRNAATVYSKILTTTHRPDYKEDIIFKTIHAADPHFLCVPSLHVTIAAGTYAWYRKIFSSFDVLPEAEAKARLEEIKAQAIAIIESVLFVKQHSVNCIPTALYMLTSAFEPGFFTIDDANKLIDELFKNSTEIDAETRREIAEYFNFMYERTILENGFAKNWQETIIRFLVEHASKTNQSLGKFKNR